jgi:Zn ribbon nucleic-acid-binding protein
MSEVFKFEGDQVQVWIEQEVIHLRAVDMGYRDPVELTGNSARELAAKLIELADSIGD